MSITKADILIVDDVPDNLHLLSKILSRQGYWVRKAVNGKMALKAAQIVVPDLILLDIMIPDLDGYQVCQQLKANTKTALVPIIFLSALGEAFDKVKAFEVGGADYVSKPFQFNEVLARVRHQLALKAAETEIRQLNIQLEARVKERTRQLEIANARLRQMALYDPLTGLPNRTFFLEQIAKAIERTKAEPTKRFAVLLLNCDRFKRINDALGHLVGDQLLVAIAQRLERILSNFHTFAHFGGDEFALLLRDISNSQDAVIFAQEILTLFADSFQLQHHEVFINASIGIALGTPNYEQPEHVLRNAHTAMHSAKTSRTKSHLFELGMHQRAAERLELENNLRRAIERQEFIVYYQPIVKLSSKQVVGFEALIRWYHPTRGMVSPELFIPIAEETGLIEPIGLWVLQEACSQLWQWQQSGLTEDALTISVNLSARQFTQPDILDQIDQILIQTQLKPQYLKLEITESVIIDNPELAIATLKSLKKRQIQLSLDDFGTGYSSLSYLHSFPIDNLKIDRCFVKRLENCAQTELIPLIIDVAHRMAISVTAEGIEIAQQLAKLRSLNCEFGQGYFFSKPLTATEAMNLIAQANFCLAEEDLE